MILSRSSVASLSTAAFASVAALAPDLANAAIDVSSAVTSISTDGAAAITAVGGAMLALSALAIVFKWAKAAIFG